MMLLGKLFFGWLCSYGAHIVTSICSLCVMSLERAHDFIEMYILFLQEENYTFRMF